MKAALIGVAVVAAVMAMGLFELGGIPKTRSGWLVALLVVPFVWLTTEVLGELVTEGIRRLPIIRSIDRRVSPGWSAVLQSLVLGFIVLLLFVAYHVVRSRSLPHGVPWWDSYFRN